MPTPVPTPTPGPAGYDAELARRLGADEYGMARYVMAFLKPGPTRDQPEEEAKRLMKAHLANIERLASDGKLVLAGPFLDDGPLAGIYVFKVATVEEARALTATDPAIQAGRLVMELHPWYGSAALQEINAIHKRLQQKRVAE
ncbi:MAG TPA: YciI family protein [Kofleriaceae bacterium]|nr:YciI family protein [Kofleriaceae bacterium]